MRIATTAAFAILLGNAAQADTATYQLDPEHTAVYFTVDHVGYAKTLGIFTKLTGTFAYDDASHELGDVDVSIDAASIESFNKGRDKHVRSKDFLNVEAHPAITFTATGGDVAGAANGTTITEDWESSPNGSVSVGLPPSVSAVLATPLIEALSQTLPNVELTVAEAFSGYLHGWLDTDEIDFGFVFNQASNSTTDVFSLLEEELYLITDPQTAASLPTPIRLSELAELPF